jgi:hypothetical protein
LRCRCTFAFNPDKPKRLHVHDQGSKGIPRNCVAELIASFTDEGDKADDSIYFGVFRFYINRQPAFAALCYTGAGLHAPGRARATKAAVQVVSFLSREGGGGNSCAATVHVTGGVYCTHAGSWPLRLLDSLRPSRLAGTTDLAQVSVLSKLKAQAPADAEVTLTLEESPVETAISTTMPSAAFPEAAAADAAKAEAARMAKIDVLKPQADDAMARGNFKAAAATYSHALCLDPDRV